jgi:uncharacterized RDD family membrane protein YckC
MTQLRIRTPEGVEFSLPLAGPLSRALAYLVDFTLVIAGNIVLTSVLSALALISADLSQALVQLGVFILPILYGVLSEWLWNGQTVGKRMFQLRVVDAQGLKIRFGQLLLRNLLRAVDFLPLFYLVGGITTLLNRRNQRLGDIAAGTVVIRAPKISAPNLDSILGARFNSLRTFPHLAARLRQRIPAAEAAIALQALSRREELDADARIRLFGELARDFRTQVGFPPEVVESLTDEQYVRNVVDVLYRPKDNPGR